MPNLFTLALLIAATSVSCVEGDNSDDSLNVDADSLDEIEAMSVEAVDDEHYMDIRMAPHPAEQNPYKQFYISNPAGNAYGLTVTASIPSGTGKITDIQIFNQNPPFTWIHPPCNVSGGYGTSSCKTYFNLPKGCTNYGTSRVYVSYTGSVAPKLQYWYFDC